MGVNCKKILMVSVALATLSACAANKPRPPAPVYDLKLAGRSSGNVSIAPGDTLGEIAERYNLTLDDIIRANTMTGGDVQAGQRLLLPPPRQYTVRTGDTVASVAGMFDTKTNTLIAKNNLSAPYALRAGQVLQLPEPQSKQKKQSPAQLTSVETEQTFTPRPPSIGPSVGSVEVEALPAPTVSTAPDIVRPSSFQVASGPAPKFSWPVEGNIVSDYGTKTGGLFNDGINIAADAGTPVRAAAQGTVVYAGDNLEGYGNMVLLRHDDGYFSVYSHMADTRVAKNATVNAGQTIGHVGASGKVDTPQLHFEIRNGTKSLNPRSLF